jgi:hypothetical protein
LQKSLEDGGGIRQAGEFNGTYDRLYGVERQCIALLFDGELKIGLGKKHAGLPENAKGLYENEEFRSQEAGGTFPHSSFWILGLTLTSPTVFFEFRM